MAIRDWREIAVFALPGYDRLQTLRVAGTEGWSAGSLRPRHRVRASRTRRRSTSRPRVGLAPPATGTASWLWDLSGCFDADLVPASPPGRHTQPVKAVRFVDEHTVASGGDEGIVYSWDIPSWTAVTASGIWFRWIPSTSTVCLSRA